MEAGALANFLASPGPLKSGLEKFIAEQAQQYRIGCAALMASVPRDTERAADAAAKAQLLDEFWAVLQDEITNLSNALAGANPVSVEE